MLGPDLGHVGGGATFEGLDGVVDLLEHDLDLLIPVHLGQDLYPDPGRLAEEPIGDHLEWGVGDGVVEFAGTEDQYDAIAAGRVDAVSGTVLTVEQQAAILDGFEALPSFPALDEDGEPILGCGGYGFMDEELRDAFNVVLNELQAEGVVHDIVEEQLGSRALAEDAEGLTLEDLIGG
ncbi:hypothetical protein BH23ACT5_BH23ACT5_16870 [soil metagenome]